MILQQPFAITNVGSFNGFDHYTAFTIATGQVPSTQTDFPILINVTDNRFKTIANGGHVSNSSGFDIRPYSDSGITTAITGYELEFYDGTAGTVVMWIKRSSVDDALVTYLAYGNSTISTDGSSTATWSNSFISVFHLKDGTTLDVNDSTGNHNGTNHSGTATTGKIDGGIALASASSQYVSTAAFVGSAAATWSIWAKGTSFPGAYNVTIGRNSGNTIYNFVYVKSTGKCAWSTSLGGVQVDPGSATLSTGTWYHLVMAYDSTNGLKCYVNATSDATASANGNLSNASIAYAVGRDDVNGRYWNGSLDEARIASVARSANWITTEYNNQSAPGTFLTIGTEV